MQSPTLALAPSPVTAVDNSRTHEPHFLSRSLPPAGRQISRSWFGCKQIPSPSIFIVVVENVMLMAEMVEQLFKD
ncbi:hypothetical protein AAC387_Pa04g1047 [Persea americana]